jgi:solute carrier family 25 protein 39/40
MVQLVREKGISMLWRGLGPTLWRDVPFSGLYWAGFENIKAHLNSQDSILPFLNPIAVSFISGATSGTISALLTQPFDVLKTRRQVFTPSKGCAPEAISHRASTLPLALHVIRSEGWRALFAGVVPRCAKVAPACGLMITCYEGVGRYLGGQDK